MTDKKVEEIKTRFRSLKIIPVVKIDDAKDAVSLAKALKEGGLPCSEITFRTAAAKEAIQSMLEAYPDMLVGAGTILTTKQVDEAVEAGAKFIVSPGLNPKIVKYCQKIGIPIFPGVATASEIEQALELGIEVVKFFPAEVNGGLPAIKALSAPYSMIQFMPTGGINQQNVKEYLDCESVIACGGTWMVKDSLIKNGEFEKIREITKETMELIL